MYKLPPVYLSTVLYFTIFIFVTICLLIHRLRTAQVELDAVMSQLKEKQERLSTIEAKVSSAPSCIPT